MTTNLHRDAIRCPICQRRFDRMEKLDQHKRARGHWAAHEHREIFGDAADDNAPQPADDSTTPLP